jgi:hypothetical protein
MNTKKILLFTGGAIALGAVGFFVWSFFQKVEIPVGETTVTLGNDTKDPDAVASNATPFNNPFTALLNTTFEPIQIPNNFSDIKNFPLNYRS